MEKAKFKRVLRAQGFGLWPTLWWRGRGAAMLLLGSPVIVLLLLAVGLFRFSEWLEDFLCGPVGDWIKFWSPYFSRLEDFNERRRAAIELLLRSH